MDLSGGDVEVTLGDGVVIVGGILTVFSAVVAGAAEAVGSLGGTAAAGLDTLTVSVGDDVTVTVSTLAVEVKVVDAVVVGGLQTEGTAVDVAAAGAAVVTVTGGVWTGLVGLLVAITFVLAWAVEDGTELAEDDDKVVTGDTAEALTVVVGLVVGIVVLVELVARRQAWAVFTAVTGAAVAGGDTETGFGEAKAETLWAAGVACDRVCETIFAAGVSAGTVFKGVTLTVSGGVTGGGSVSVTATGVSTAVTLAESVPGVFTSEARGAGSVGASEAAETLSEGFTFEGADFTSLAVGDVVVGVALTGTVEVVENEAEDTEEVWVDSADTGADSLTWVASGRGGGAGTGSAGAEAKRV